MPLAPKYEWEQTDSTVEVRAHVLGANKSKADVLFTDAVLKVNCPPYLLVLDLHDDVDDAKSSAVVSSSGVTFRLVKVRLRGGQDKARPAACLTSRDMHMHLHGPLRPSSGGSFRSSRSALRSG